MRQHDFYFDTEDTLSEENVAHGSVNVFFGGVAAVDHQSAAGMKKLSENLRARINYVISRTAQGETDTYPSTNFIALAL